MSDNPYYREAFSGTEHGLARATQIRDSLISVQEGFAKLPDPRALFEDRVSALVLTGGPTAYVGTMDSPPVAYVDGIAINARFPVANAPNPTLDLLDPDGNALGAKPIRQVDGTALTAGHVAANARAELYYVGVGAGYWVLGAGARGAPGPATAPDGTFSLNAARELIFTPADGVTPANSLGKAAMLYRGVYSGVTTYRFLDIVKSGTTLYLHVGTADTAGVPVTNTAVWQPLARDGNDGNDGADGLDAALKYAFSTSTSITNPAAGDIRLNNATPASVTQIAIDDTDADANDLAAYWATLDDTGIVGNYGMLFIRDRTDDDLLIYKVTAVADNSGWTRLTVTHVAGTSRPADNAALAVWFQPAGPSPIRVLSQSAYDAATKDAATFYYIEA